MPCREPAENSSCTPLLRRRASPHFRWKIPFVNFEPPCRIGCALPGSPQRTPFPTLASVPQTAPAPSLTATVNPSNRAGNSFIRPVKPSSRAVGSFNRADKSFNRTDKSFSRADKSLNREVFLQNRARMTLRSARFPIDTLKTPFFHAPSPVQTAAGQKQTGRACCPARAVPQRQPNGAHRVTRPTFRAALHHESHPLQ